MTQGGGECPPPPPLKYGPVLRQLLYILKIKYLLGGGDSRTPHPLNEALLF